MAKLCLIMSGINFTKLKISSDKHWFILFIKIKTLNAINNVEGIEI